MRSKYRTEGRRPRNPKSSFIFVFRQYAVSYPDALHSCIADHWRGCLFSSWFQTSFSPLWNSSALPQVKISQGLVIGTILDQNFPGPIDAFMGLPYAEAPIGDRRFRRAVPLPNSNQTFKAQAYGPMYVLVVSILGWLLNYLQMSWQTTAQRQKCT